MNDKKNNFKNLCWRATYILLFIWGARYIVLAPFLLYPYPPSKNTLESLSIGLVFGLTYVLVAYFIRQGKNLGSIIASVALSLHIIIIWFRSGYLNFVLILTLTASIISIIYLTDDTVGRTTITENKKRVVK